MDIRNFRPNYTRVVILFSAFAMVALVINTLFSYEPEQISDSVSHILEGDVILTRHHAISLSLVNTPGPGEDGFENAVLFTESLCPVNSIVIIDKDNLQPFDADGNTVAKVICKDDKILNLELLNKGHATLLEPYCDTSEFAKEFGC
ncbi:thermonuclease family protein [Nitrosopumilus sp.]|uniref:thermonuclease family protein n=1 Tax=Nitrosopumilus sp. TaxID=2024843 RepID=UPI003D0AAD2A